MKGDRLAHETLGNDVIPYHYRLRFDTDFKSFNFRGDAEIFAMAKPGVKVIQLNSKELKIKSAEIENLGRIQDARIAEDKGRERITLIVGSPISGICKIRISFEGVNNDKMHGFYRSSYKAGNKTHYLLTSQFESTDARAAFPCFDEPAMKATFSVSIVADKEYMVLSNMPIEKETIRGGRKETLFHTTPKMSTYLLFLGVGKFDYAGEKRNGVSYRVLTVPGKKRYAMLALDYAEKFVSQHEKYFGIKYMLPKLDLIAIPDFAAGAMENWGAITFREYMLLGTGESSVSVKQTIADTVAHELAHQWFGDLVTMKWWDDLWLNESFATYMSNKAVDAVFPEWKFGVQYLNDTVASALNADEFRDTHPISVPVKSPAEIEEIFDRISYDKGGSVLRMVEDFVGEETFRKGLNLYLNTHLYGNATKDDLWYAIGEEAKREGKNLDIKQITNAWTDRQGYPEIDVSVEGNSYLLEQKRCLLVANGKGVKEDMNPMPVPLHYVYSDGVEGFMIFDKREARIPKRGCSWIKLNYGQKGVYRVNYSDSILESLGRSVALGKIDPVDAWGIETDLFDKVRKGEEKAAKYIDFVASYYVRCGYPANTSVSAHLVWIYNQAYASKTANRAGEAIVKLDGGWLKKLGWSRKLKDNNTDIMMRSAAISALGTVGEKRTVEKALDLFNGKGAVEQDIRGAVYGIAAWAGNSKVYDRLESMYKKAVDPEEQRRLLFSLGSFRGENLARKALAFNDSEYVRLQDSIFIPTVIASNPTAGSTYWTWLSRNWNRLAKAYRGVPRMLSRLVDAAGARYSPIEYNSKTRFFNKKGVVTPEIRRNVAQMKERLVANRRFIENNA